MLIDQPRVPAGQTQATRELVGHDAPTWLTSCPKETLEFKEPLKEPEIRNFLELPNGRS